jgi:hypothetical protein
MEKTPHPPSSGLYRTVQTSVGHPLPWGEGCGTRGGQKERSAEPFGSALRNFLVWKLCPIVRFCA